MGFNEVFKKLLELFPEVDPRALRAVALEHNKDGDAAAEVVLSEIVPFFVKLSRSPSSSSGKDSSTAVAAGPSGFTLNNEGILVETSDSEDEERSGSSFYNETARNCNDDHVEVHVDFSNEVAVKSEKSQEENRLYASDLANGIVHAQVSLDTDESSDCEMVMSGNEDELQGSSSAQDKSVSLSPERNGEFVVGDTISTESKYLEPNGSPITEANKDNISDIDIKDDSSLNTMVSRSTEICRAEFLEGLVSDARNNKKTLFAAMESVISLMRKVELQEDATEQAKEEAANGGLTILNTVEEIISMLKRAKEANDMRAGEVYGERAVLATEARELQARLFSLSEERDKSLAILDEMHDSLLSRLEAAEEKEKMAEKEKLEKEERARSFLAEQELTMEKVVQESNMLNQMAEENAKLQEFLEDRGHVVDSLQGEISVICQDVRVLREKFDDHAPLSKSFSSRYTSSKLASSFSSSYSSRSVASDQVNEVPDQSHSSANLQQSGPSMTTNEPLLMEQQPSRDDKKALVEEGWEIFDNADYTYKD